MGNSNKIIVVGSSSKDYVAVVDDFPGPGETKLSTEYLENYGGKGANQAVAAARCGGDVVFVGKVGEDATGDQILKNLKSEGINTSKMRQTNDQASGVALIFVNEEGENSIVVAQNANMTLDSNDIDNASALIEEAETILMQLEIPIETVLYTAKKGREMGKKVILNPAPATKLPDELYPNLFMVTPNETETEILTGIKITGQASAAKAAEVLKDKGVEIVIITMGAQGAYIHSDKLKKLVPAPKVKAVDTTAAGDCFNGALAVGLAQKKPFDEAVSFANMAASIAVTRMGAQNSLPYKKDLDM